MKTAGSFEPNHEVLLEVEGFVGRCHELADLVRFLPGFFGSITSHVKKRTSRAPEMGHFAAYKPHCGVFVVLVGCIKLLTTAALTENGRARRGFGLFAWF